MAVNAGRGLATERSDTGCPADLDRHLSVPGGEPTPHGHRARLVDRTRPNPASAFQAFRKATYSPRALTAPRARTIHPHAPSRDIRHLLPMNPARRLLGLPPTIHIGCSLGTIEARFQRGPLDGRSLWVEDARSLVEDPDRNRPPGVSKFGQIPPGLHPWRSRPGMLDREARCCGKVPRPI